MSESEPELGLATVVHTGEGRVQVLFSATGETRTYASDNAPLKRVRFRIGDTVKTNDDKELTVKEVIEKEGLLLYVGQDQAVPEAELSASLSLRGPEDRLFAGRFDEPATFELRRLTLELLHRLRKSPVRGFVGGRIDLIPHQLYIAQEVASRQAPRVMLSDEVGLGKTIEAGLILHRLLLSERANRILVLVPESLVHQWFVEMLRRFNVWLNIFDEERCAAIEAGDPGANPFLDDQLVLTSINFLASSPTRSAQAVAAGWDVLVVDEAHHLKWSKENPSREYQIVEELSRQSEGLLLLTATPEQLGMESHFARLQLLDPDRHHDLASFLAESRDYKPTADIAEKLLTGKKPTRKDITFLGNLFAHNAELKEHLEKVGKGNAEASQALLKDLLDMHGPGRVLFRNTRAGMTGFPKRSAHLAKLDPGPKAEEWLDRVSTEFAVDAGEANLKASLDLTKDPRILWLVDLLQKLDPQKVLLICRTIEKVEAIDAALRRHVSIKTGIFHEGLTLVQRDRNAAWFAEADGARLLLCSEIGSEGRNFQFAHHLVLFDLPLNPELLEQRIGRLDRIGQTKDIHIHVPYLAHSPQEVLARWYHEGLDAFEKNLEGGNELLLRFGRAVHDLALEFSVADRSEADQELADLLERTADGRRELRQVLEQGRDRLLEMNSFRAPVARQIIELIQKEDRQTDLEDYLLSMFDHFGVHIEELAPHTWQLNPQGIITDSFPAMPAEGLIATCDRRRALGREDIGFLTWDHPMVTGAMELLLGSEAGNCSFAVLPTAGERTLLLELAFILEAIAAPRLHMDRFLPATPIRLVINHKLENVSESHPGKVLEERLRKGSPYKLLDNEQLARGTLPAMLHHASTLAETGAETLRQAALKEMNQLLGHEVQRLKTLRQVNDHIRPQEIIMAEEQQKQLATTILQARTRLDSLRLIWKGPPEILN
ncbi:SNF2-related protein [Pedosphaera parvula Ellin514]|uniref:SNF2-related protein n=2 Tax=Pedosphaera TaxID=1032526 RepID=B9XDU2_PEDPL|nr:SNF2-related protein [Pedosphaera parvula Ellin514]